MRQAAYDGFGDAFLAIDGAGRVDLHDHVRDAEDEGVVDLASEGLFADAFYLLDWRVFRLGSCHAADGSACEAQVLSLALHLGFRLVDGLLG